MIPNTYFLYCPNHHKGHGKKSPCSITKASSEKWWIFVRAGSAKFYTLHPFFLFIFQALPNLRTEAKKKKKILKKKKVLVGAWCVHSWKNDVEPYGSCHCVKLTTKFVQKLLCRFLPVAAEIKQVQGWTKKICINRSYLRGQ